MRMPVKTDREYRAMSLLLPTENKQKRLESDYYVEGYATTFDSPYTLWEHDGLKFMEQIDRHALDGADMADIIMQYDHAGKVFARNRMGGGRPATLIAEPQDGGFFIAADLSLTEESRRLYGDIESGLIYQMSWAFTVAEDSYDKETRTRTILRVKKVYDVSAVSIPANPDTDISARSWVDGLIEAEKREAQARLALARAKYNYFYGG
jgi:uncharacterized protein